MKLKRTNAIDVDSDFDVDCEITKSYERADGIRVIRGIASGVAEDRDGERVSKRGLADMARQAVAGMKLTSSHDQDWASEIGDIAVVKHNEHDELEVEAHLPPVGDDPMADKAWTRLTKHGEKLGFSIGGKLKSAYFELSPVGKKRKVLDGIALRHFALTKKASYTPSFAEAVTKTWDAGDQLVDALAPGDFTIDGEAETFEAFTVTKAASDPSTTDRNAGTKTDDTPSKDVNGEKDDDAPKKTDDEEPDEKLDKAKGRHLACPNCGHEFAADLPAELDAPADAGGEDDHDRDAKKTAPERSTMDLTKTVEELRGLVADDKPDDTPVAKTETTDDDVQKLVGDVEKMVAASHAQNTEAIADVNKAVTDGFDQIKALFGKTAEAIQELAGRPVGRQSVARVGPEHGATPPSEVRKTATAELEPGDDEDADVAKRIDEAGSLTEALKVVNEQAYGIR